MARGHGRILTSIWDDADFLALGEREQRLYLFLISQPNLNHAGLLDLTLRRWSRKARGLTSAELEKLLQALEAANFIVVDDDTEELLIRSFVRNDGVWKQPKVMGAMVSGALEISSWRLRRALLAEVGRIPLEELSADPGSRGVSIRQQVIEHIETLRKAFGNPPPDPDGRGSATPSAPPSGTPSDTPQQPPAEGGPEASTRGRAPASRAHSPAPAPAPTPAPKREGAAAAEPASPAEAGSRRPDGLTHIPDDFAITDAERRWARATFPDVDINFETDQFIRYWRGEGRRKRNWHDAWQKWIADADRHARDRQKRGADVIPFAARQQQASDDLFDRAMARANARMDQESS